MPNYFRNLEETMGNIDPSSLTRFQRFKFWLTGHLRFIWSLIMLLVMAAFVFWMSQEFSHTKKTLPQAILGSGYERALNIQSASDEEVVEKTTEKNSEK